MNRRSFLQSFSVGAIVPFQTVLSRPRTGGSTRSGEERYLTAVLDGETGRVLKQYEVHYDNAIRVEWTIETLDGEVLYRTDYPLHQTSEQYYDDAVEVEYYTEPPDRELRGRSYISLRADNVYHKHILDRETVVTYRENIETGEYTRIT